MLLQAFKCFLRAGKLLDKCFSFVAFTRQMNLAEF